MKPGQSKLTAESGKPFKLVKYFSASALIIVLIFSIGLSGFLADQSKRVLLDRYEAYAIVLAANLNHQVFRQFSLPTATLYGKIDLSSEYQYRRLDKVVRATIHSLNVDQVNAYDLNGIRVYTTADLPVGEPVKLGSGFEKARLGQSSSQLVGDPSIFDFVFHGRITEPVKLTSFTPFRADRLSVALDDPRPVLGVFELITDLTPEMEQIFRHEVLVGLTALGLMILMFIILALIVRNGEKILVSRAEERKRLEDKLAESERLAELGRMVASVSHEIKSPLGIIRSTSELMSRQMGEGDPSRQLSEVIVEECNRLNGIVIEFLDFARPQVPHLRDCDLAELLRRNLAALAPELDSKQIELEADIDGAPVIQADPDMLYRVFLNIMVNAVQAMPQGGRLTVKAVGPGGDNRAVIEISDTGPGLDEEALERAFEPFYTLKEQGSGLGLAIVKSIVQAHDGSITIESQPGRGATFRIVF